MSSAIATSFCVLGILGLLWLDRDPRAKPSAALWLPSIWMAIACSRPMGEWLGMGAPVDSPSQVLDGSPTDRAFFAFLLALGVVVLFTRKKVIEILRANGAILFFYTYCTISILWSDFPGTALKRLPKALGDVVMILIVLTDPQPLAAFRRLLGRLTYVLIPLSILFIKYIPQLGMGWNLWTGGAVFTGVTTNKNTLGAVCLFFGLGTIWRVIGEYQDDRKIAGRTRRLIAHGVILVMIAYLFAKMNSMTSLSCLFMAGAVLVAASTRMFQRRPKLVFLLIVGMITISASILFLGVDPQALKAIGRNPTLTDRTIIWSDMLTQVRHPLFGTGFQSFWLGPRLAAIWQMTPDLRPNEAHNGYLEIYLNLGWIGIGLLGFTLAVGFRTAFKAWRNRDPRGSLLLAYFFTGVVYNFTEAAFFQMQAVAWLFFLFAIVDAGGIFSLAAKRTVSIPAQARVQHAKYWEKSVALGENVR